MNASLVTQEHAQYSEEQRRLITDVLCRGASPVEVAFFVEVAQRCKLDPFRRQIYAVKRYDSQAKREILTFQVGIDGLRAIAARTGEYAGNDEPVFQVDGDAWHPTKASVTVYRMVHGQRIPFTASVYWAEYVQTTREGKVTSMWNQRPFGQLGKCAEAAALRKAFPEEAGGLYTGDEFQEGTLRSQSAAPSAQLATVPDSAEITLRGEEPAQMSAPERLIESEPQHSRALLDLMTMVEDATEGVELKRLIADAEALDTPAATKMVKRAINSKAANLRLTWDVQTASFITTETDD
jgi:phage recombination protein Bet